MDYWARSLFQWAADKITAKVKYLVKQYAPVVSIAMVTSTILSFCIVYNVLPVHSVQLYAVKSNLASHLGEKFMDYRGLFMDYKKYEYKNMEKFHLKASRTPTAGYSYVVSLRRPSNWNCDVSSTIDVLLMLKSDLGTVLVEKLQTLDICQLKDRPGKPAKKIKKRYHDTVVLSTGRILDTVSDGVLYAFSPNQTVHSLTMDMTFNCRLNYFSRLMCFFFTRWPVAIWIYCLCHAVLFIILIVTISLIQFTLMLIKMYVAAKIRIIVLKIRIAKENYSARVRPGIEGDVCLIDRRPSPARENQSVAPTTYKETIKAETNNGSVEPQILDTLDSSSTTAQPSDGVEQNTYTQAVEDTVVKVKDIASDKLQPDSSSMTAQPSDGVEQNTYTQAVKDTVVKVKDIASDKLQLDSSSMTAQPSDGVEQNPSTQAVKDTVVKVKDIAIDKLQLDSSSMTAQPSDGVEQNPSTQAVKDTVVKVKDIVGDKLSETKDNKTSSKKETKTNTMEGVSDTCKAVDDNNKMKIKSSASVASKSTAAKSQEDDDIDVKIVNLKIDSSDKLVNAADLKENERNDLKTKTN